MSNTNMPVLHRVGELSLTERGLSIGAGLFLAAAASRPRPNVALNVMALALGSFLAYRGATGYCPVRAALADRLS